MVAEALAREVGAVSKAIHRLDARSWALPTRCPPMTVKDLVAHVARGGARLIEMLAVEPLDDEPEKDAVTYFQYDADTEAPQILARAQQIAASLTPEQLVRRWDEDWVRALQGVRRVLAGGDPVLPSVFGTMRLSEYLKTRAVEVVVHHLDLDDALGHAPHPDAEAATIAADVLRGLLGTDLRPVGMDDVRFLTVGTGRAPLDEREVAYLGPLAAKFPLLT